MHVIISRLAVHGCVGRAEIAVDRVFVVNCDLGALLSLSRIGKVTDPRARDAAAERLTIEPASTSR